ncbi:MGH1-like glycoside hydrolase domain-containing protein [Oceanomicrobium pacificus]|uniref:Mannosylglycerate hydrolase MGH1-like glycoside hydrolase domain-containing protein n=1 Tax=Oceanomicrobium pacificus TaxID=2692916 RepID=A0A6B0TNH1_9RHOB|nr:hypothetical protein [Oceanomicrobium pacificus]MXU64129.1 hypothetical protein [Oceanomicrobium pacificus]
MKDRTLDLRAVEILQKNDRGLYTVPTSGLYPYQWNWDSAFAALGFAEFNLDRAWTEIDTLFNAQWDNGMVPHIIFHRRVDGYFPGPDVWGTNSVPASSGITQPPVAASIVRHIYDHDPGIGRAHVERLLPKLVAWHRWFHDYRCEAGPCAVTHPWESGRDNAPDWDAAMAAIDTSGVGEYTRRDTAHVDASMRPTKEDYDRYLAILYFGRDHEWDEAAIRDRGPFRVADPAMSFILMRANRDLADMLERFGQDRAEVDGWIAELEAGVEDLWNADLGAYDARDLRTGDFAGSLSSGSFLSWYGGLRDDRMLDWYDKVAGALPYGVPSYYPQGAKFNAKRYWRGPVWGIVNRLIAVGLADAGHADRAEQLRERTAELIRKGGFHEYFDPEDGSAAGGGTFTWTAAIWLAWASSSSGRAAA